MLRDAVEFAKSFSDEINILTMALDTTGNNEGLLGSDIVHHELLHHAGINVADVTLETKAGHAECLVTEGCTEEQVLVVGEGVVLKQVLVKIMALLGLGAGNISGKDRAGLEGAVNHHLEHVCNVVLDAVATKVGALLVVFHGHVATRHLNHSVVNGLVGVFECLEVGILESEHGAGCFSSLITSSNIHKHT